MSRAGLADYMGALEQADAHLASDVVLGLLDEGMPLAEITSDVLGPAQVAVGLRWEQGDWSVADEHAATAVTETALAALTHAARTRPGTGQNAAHVVLACVEGEWHTLPARMVAAVTATGEVRATVLGPSLPADHLGRRLAAGDVDLVALSCTMPSNLFGAARCIKAAHEHGIPVIAGGRAFGSSAHRAYAVAADAWSPDAAALLAPKPVLAGRRCDISAEVLLLDAVDDGVITLAYERMVASFPRLPGMTEYQQARTREDLRWMARFTAAAVLTRDEVIVDDLLLWLDRLLAGRVPTGVLATSAHLLAATIEPFATTGAAVLHDAADRLEVTGRAA